MRLITVLAALVAAPAAAGAADLTLSVEGLRNRAGKVSVCLFCGPEAFPDCERAPGALRRTVPSAKAGQPVVFHDLPAGSYAATVLHDENGDGRLDTNLLGIPKEGVGITNNALPRFSAPRFSDARFEMPGARGQSVRIVYW